MVYLICCRGTVSLLQLQTLLEMKTPFTGEVTLKVSRPAELSKRSFVQWNDCFGLKKVVRFDNSLKIFNFFFITYVLLKNRQLHGDHHMYVANTKELNMGWLVNQLVNVSSVGRALQQNHGSQGFSSFRSPYFFLLLSFIFTSAHGDGLENLILDQDIHILVSLLH